MAQQRKQVTILFFYMDGLTTLAEMHGSRLADELWEAIDFVLKLYNGQANPPIGDFTMALFGAPVAHEDDPEQAVLAALAVQAAFAAFIAEHSIRIVSLQIMIHTGFVLYSSLGISGRFMAVGEAVNLVSQLARVLPDEEMLLTHETYRLVRGLFDVSPLPPVSLSSRADQVPVYRVRQRKERPLNLSAWAIAGIETPFVGRTAEAAQLKQALSDVVLTRRMIVLTIVGEAGTGKTRLQQEFIRWIELLPDFYFLWRGQAQESMRLSPYRLMREIFAARFDIQSSDSTEIACQKFQTQAMALLGGDEMERSAVQLLGQLLGFDFSFSPRMHSLLNDAQQLQQQAFDVLVRFFKLAVAGQIEQSRPERQFSALLIFLEDMQWADQGTLELLTHLIASCPDLPIMIVCQARPVFLAENPSWPLALGTAAPPPFHVLQHILLHLPPLSPEAALELTRHILSKLPDPPPSLLDLILERAEGNPFYIEEMIKMLIEDGAILTGNNEWQLRPDRLAEIQPPTTLTSLLQASLDALPELERETLQRAAVIGRLFWNMGVMALASEDQAPLMSVETINRILRSLESKGFITRHKESIFAGTVEYSFKYTLLQEIIYENLLRRLRRIYHNRTAVWLILSASDRMVEYAGLIAEHFELGDEKEQAVLYLHQAGEEAASRFANEEAISYFTRALQFVEEDEMTTRYLLLLAREKVWGRLGDRERQLHDLQQLQTITEALVVGKRATATQIAAWTADVVLRQADFAQAIGDFSGATDAARRMVELAEGIQDDGLLAAAYLAWGRALWRLSRYDEAREKLNVALATVRSRQIIQLEAEVLRLLGNLASYRADYARARELYAEALDICRRTGDRYGESLVINNLGTVAGNQGDYASSLRYFKEALLMDEEFNSRSGKSTVLNNLGFILRHLGEYQQAIIYHEQSLLLCQEIENRQSESLQHTNLSLIYHNLGDNKRAFSTGQRGLTLAREVKSRHVEGYALTHIGHALLELNWAEEAIRVYREAIELRQELKQPNMVIEPRAGLVRVYAAEEDMAAAMVQLELIMAHLADGRHQLNGVLEPFRVCWSCYQLLEKIGDARAPVFLIDTYEWLQEQADYIDLVQLRQSFLTRVESHRLIVAAYQQLMQQGQSISGTA